MIIFITGTDTGVGKTFVTALLAKCLAEKGVDVMVQKWVSTGNSDVSEDCLFIKDMAGLKQDITPGSPACPYCLDFPASPHLAAEMQHVELDPARIESHMMSLARRCEVLLVEGVGGALVPLNRQVLLMDFVAKIGLPVLIVARSGLGTINHTLLTIEALKTRGLEILGVVLNGLKPDDPRIVEDNRGVIAGFGGVEVFGPVPKVNLPEDALYSMEPILARIMKAASSGMV